MKNAKNATQVATTTERQKKYEIKGSIDLSSDYFKQRNIIYLSEALIEKQKMERIEFIISKLELCKSYMFKHILHKHNIDTIKSFGAEYCLMKLLLICNIDIKLHALKISNSTGIKYGTVVKLINKDECLEFTSKAKEGTLKFDMNVADYCFMLYENIGLKINILKSLINK